MGEKVQMEDVATPAENRSVLIGKEGDCLEVAETEVVNSEMICSMELGSTERELRLKEPSQMQHLSPPAVEVPEPKKRKDCHCVMTEKDQMEDVATPAKNRLALIVKEGDCLGVSETVLAESEMNCSVELGTLERELRLKGCNLAAVAPDLTKRKECHCAMAEKDQTEDVATPAEIRSVLIGKEGDCLEVAENEVANSEMICSMELGSTERELRLKEPNQMQHLSPPAVEVPEPKKREDCHCIMAEKDLMEDAATPAENRLALIVKEGDCLEVTETDLAESKMNCSVELGSLERELRLKEQSQLQFATPTDLQYGCGSKQKRGVGRSPYVLRRRRKEHPIVEQDIAKSIMVEYVGCKVNGDLSSEK
jgi:bifunctional DNA-binding transcriptional regulator/antitoxin component of YhaV-PrlF toxin-antitoxin module